MPKPSKAELRKKVELSRKKAKLTRRKAKLGNDSASLFNLTAFAFLIPVLIILGLSRWQGEEIYGYLLIGPMLFLGDLILRLLSKEKSHITSPKAGGNILGFLPVWLLGIIVFLYVINEFAPLVIWLQASLYSGTGFLILVAIGIYIEENPDPNAGVGKVQVMKKGQFQNYLKHKAVRKRKEAEEKRLKQAPREQEKEQEQVSSREEPALVAVAPAPQPGPREAQPRPGPPVLKKRCPVCRGLLSVPISDVRPITIQCQNCEKKFRLKD